MQRKYRIRLRISSLRQGIALMREERYEAAYPWLQKAVQEERRNPEAWYWYEKIGRAHV